MNDLSVQTIALLACRCQREETSILSQPEWWWESEEGVHVALHPKDRNSTVYARIHRIGRSGHHVIVEGTEVDGQDHAIERGQLRIESLT